MSCWVVPTVAAGYWNVPLDEVMRRIEQSEVPTKNDLGFVLVDVAPHQPNLTFGKLAPEQRPPTFKPIADPTPMRIAPVDDDPTLNEVEIGLAVANGDWRRSRELVGQRRRQAA
ncbi:MAG TPA: hypothetical protein PKB10_11630 [Tepidisphaeraceae bacterium]|nr:hypothetical protein [Tepidisphaeraceae bacterium]